MDKNEDIGAEWTFMAERKDRRREFGFLSVFEKFYFDRTSDYNSDPCDPCRCSSACAELRAGQGPVGILCEQFEDPRDGDHSICDGK